MTDVHQCPGCELKFPTRNELHDHIAKEHAAFDDPLKTGKTHVLTDAEIAAGLARLTDWAHEAGTITRTVQFPTFGDAIAFVDRVAAAADAADHHPDIDIRYNKVRLALATHSAGGITSKDMKLAAEIDRLALSAS